MQWQVSFYITKYLAYEWGYHFAFDLMEISCKGTLIGITLVNLSIVEYSKVLLVTKIFARSSKVLCLNICIAMGWGDDPTHPPRFW